MEVLDISRIEFHRRYSLLRNDWEDLIKEQLCGILKMKNGPTNTVSEMIGIENEYYGSNKRIMGLASNDEWNTRDSNLCIPVRSFFNPRYPLWVGPVTYPEAGLSKNGKSFLQCFDIRPIDMNSKEKQDILDLNISPINLFALTVAHEWYFSIRIFENHEEHYLNHLIACYHNILDDLKEMMNE